MKRILSMILAIVMFVLLLPASVLAEEEEASSVGIMEEITEEAATIPENYGTEVWLGERLYYIEDGNLLCSVNNARPVTTDTDVKWVIEEKGDVYYSKLDGYNTYILKVGVETEIARIFCPVECFDVDGDDIYYLYNGEVTSYNIQTNEEKNIVVDKTMNGFYLKNSDVVAINTINKKESEPEHEENNEIQLGSITLVKKSQKAVSAFYSNTTLSGTQKVILYDKQGNPKKYLSFNKSKKVSLLIENDYYTKGKKSEEWVSINFDGIGFLYAKKADLKNKFWTLTELLKKGEMAAEYISSRYLLNDAPELLTDYLKVDTSTAGPMEPKDENADIKVTKFDWPSFWARVLGCFLNSSGLIGSILGSLLDSSNTIMVLGTVYNEGTYWYLLEDNTYVKKSELDKYFRRVPGQSASSVITFSSIVAPTGTIKKAGYPLGGIIRSSCNIKTITGRVINVATGVAELTKPVDVYAQKYSISGSALDNGLQFRYLQYGNSYYLQYDVVDITGNTRSWKSGVFAVEAAPVQACQTPTVAVSNIEGGQRVVALNNEGSLIHLRINGGERTGWGSVSADLTSPGSYVIDAWATADGKPASSVVTRSVSVSSVRTPAISNAKYLEDKVQITLSGDGEIYYTTNGSTPTKWSTKYTSPIYIKDTKTIKAMAAAYGYVNSAVAEKTVKVSAPETPTLKLESPDKVAQGKSVKVSWGKTERAYEYTAYLMKDGNAVKKQTTKNNYATFVLDEKNDNENIEYTIKVVASNFKGNSNDSNIITVTAMHPVKITVTDRIVRENGVDDEAVAEIQERIYNHYGDDAEEVEGNIISVQKIDYNTKPSKPVTPSKKGFDFAGYSEELYRAATEDTEVYALYEVKYYNVTFYDTENGKRRLEPLALDSYMYTEPAVEPTNYEVPYGYVFSGWNVDNAVSECFDLTFVDGDMVLDAVYSWKNEELPVAVRIDSIVRDDKSYKVTVSLKNAPSTGTDGVQGRIIAALYTEEGKVVYTQIHDLDSEFLNNTHNFDHSETVTLNYSDNISYASIYVVGVKGSKTGGALSEVVTNSNINYAEGSKFWTEWSAWQKQKIEPTEEMQVRTETQYTYRDKSFTTRTDTKTLDGWTYYDTTIRKTTGPTTTTTEVKPIDTDARKRTVTKKWIEEGHNEWNFYRYWGQTSGGSYRVCAYKSGICVNYEETGWIPYALPWESVDYFGGQGYNAYAPEGTPFDTRNGLTYYYGGIRWVDTSHWEYTYTNTYYTHHFYKWSEYAKWDFVKPESKKDREIKTRTVYSYRTVTDSAHETQEETVYTYNKSGILENITEDFSGEKATVLIYKKTNTDPTEEQIEYVSQIEIGEGNSYKIEANTRELPHYQKTGDFIVALAFEGGEKLINVDYIKAPLPEYTVDFYSDGELYRTVTVEEGGSIDVNEIGIPWVAGKRFVKWNSSLVNIKKNMDVNAVFEPETVSIIFVDYENETVQVEDVAYGDDMIRMPDVEGIEGKTFSHWKNVTSDINIPQSVPGTGGGMTVMPGTGMTGMSGTSSDLVKSCRIYEAVWIPKTYVVNFADLDGNIIDTQYVNYGEAATLPEFVEKDGIVYSWDVSNSEWWDVKCDMYIYPYVPYESEVCVPTINVATDTVGGSFYAELDTAEEGATIYYSYFDEITEELAHKIAAEKLKDSTVESGNAEEISLMSEDGILEETEEEFVFEYKDAIEISEGTIIYAFVVGAEGSISPISVFEFGYDVSEDAGIIENTYQIDPNSPAIMIPDVSAKPGESISVPVSIKNNPGIEGLSLIIGCDMNNLKLVEVENGDVFEDGEFREDTRDDGSCKFTWEADRIVDGDGTLLTLTFMVSENAEDYDITVTVEEATDSYGEDQPFAVVDGVVKNDPTVLGDVNGDGEVDFVDGMRILKHDVGLITLTDDELAVGDVNDDGEVDFADAILVLKFDVGLISSFKK